MKSKEKERLRARHLRYKGFSVKEIASNLGVAKSSVSTWVRDVELTKKQLVFLKHKPHLKEVIKKRVETRLKHENEKRRLVMENHKKEIFRKKLTIDNLKILGTTLYWAEGGKSHKNRTFSFSNSDPKMIKVMMIFLKNICEVQKEKFRGHIHLHSHLNKDSAEEYWSLISTIPKSQFYKTTQIINKASKNTRDTLPYGTFSIQVGSTDLFLKMLAWIDAINEKLVTTYN